MTRKLFGTDGIRQKAGEGIFTESGLLHFGAVLSIWLKENLGISRPSILIGHDTRESGQEYSKAIASGAEAQGAKVVRVGVMTTPAVAYLTGKFAIDLGISVSASHNAWNYNGIKCFSRNGLKLKDEQEQQIEELLENIPHSNSKKSSDGCFLSCNRHYLEFLTSKTDGISFKGISIALDCANGAAFQLAPVFFENIGAKVFSINTVPDGKNINKNCGSLYPEEIAKLAREKKADIGFSFDGDGDRLIISDGKGNTFDGDYIMAIISKFMIKDGLLRKNTLVTTQMSNIGLEISIKESGGNIIRTDVGDKFVLDEMLKSGYNFGGEQSGHLIFLEHSTTGDGLLTAIQILKILKRTDKTITELCECMKKYPQVLLNVEVKEKKPFDTLPNTTDSIEEEKRRLGDAGRIFVRYSGTEPLARIMIEGPDHKFINDMAQRLAQAIRKDMG